MKDKIAAAIDKLGLKLGDCITDEQAHFVLRNYHLPEYKHVPLTAEHEPWKGSGKKKMRSTK